MKMKFYNFLFLLALVKYLNAGMPRIFYLLYHIRKLFNYFFPLSKKQMSIVEIF